MRESEVKALYALMGGSGKVKILKEEEKDSCISDMGMQLYREEIIFKFKGKKYKAIFDEAPCQRGGGNSCHEIFD
jgi:hypothetical protein